MRDWRFRRSKTTRWLFIWRKLWAFRMCIRFRPIGTNWLVSWNRRVFNKLWDIQKSQENYSEKTFILIRITLSLLRIGFWWGRQKSLRKLNLKRKRERLIKALILESKLKDNLLERNPIKLMKFCKRKEIYKWRNTQINTWDFLLRKSNIKSNPITYKLTLKKYLLIIGFYWFIWLEFSSKLMPNWFFIKQSNNCLKRGWILKISNRASISRRSST